MEKALPFRPALTIDWDTLPPTAQDTVFSDELNMGNSLNYFVPLGTTNEYRNGNALLWVAGRITCTDVFGKPHWMTFCAWHVAGQPLDSFAACDILNDSDRD